MNFRMHPEYSEYKYYEQKMLEEKEKQRMQDFLDVLKKRNQFTPDASKIRLRDNILLFVYDNMMYGGFDNNYLRTCKYLGKGRTALQSYIVKSSEKNSIVAFDIDKEEKGGIIAGEVYVITPNILMELDELKENGDKFIRVQKHVVLPDQFYSVKSDKIKNPILECMFYIGNKKMWPHTTMKNIGCVLTVKNKRIYEYHTRSARPPSIFDEMDDNDAAWYNSQYPHRGAYMM